MKEKIKNLYNKKSIKITFRILTILVYLFTIIMILLLSLGSCSYDHNDNNVIKKDKPINNVAYREPNYYITFTEILSREYLNSLKLFMQREYNGYYSSWANPTTSGYGAYINLLQDSPVTPSDNNIDRVFYISQIGSSGTPSPVFEARRLRLYSTQTHYDNFWINFYMIGFGNDGNGYEYTLEYYEYLNITDTTNLPDYTLSSSLYSSTIFYQNLNVSEDRIVPTDYAFYFRKNSTCYLMSSYYIANLAEDNTFIDYYDGYTDGYTIGYREGHQEGFNEGQEELSINGASPFLLLKQGADAIASLLDIKLLPFLSLGTLMFTPIIIALIIVIIKMVKG